MERGRKHSEAGRAGRQSTHARHARRLSRSFLASASFLLWLSLPPSSPRNVASVVSRNRAPGAGTLTQSTTHNERTDGQTDILFFPRGNAERGAVGDGGGSSSSNSSGTRNGGGGTAEIVSLRVTFLSFRPVAKEAAASRRARAAPRRAGRLGTETVSGAVFVSLQDEHCERIAWLGFFSDGAPTVCLSEDARDPATRGVLILGRVEGGEGGRPFLSSWRFFLSFPSRCSVLSFRVRGPCSPQDLLLASFSFISSAFRSISTSACYTHTHTRVYADT